MSPEPEKKVYAIYYADDHCGATYQTYAKALEAAKRMAGDSCEYVVAEQIVKVTTGVVVTPCS